MKLRKKTHHRLIVAFLMFSILTSYSLPSVAWAREIEASIDLPTIQLEASQEFALPIPEKISDVPVENIDISDKDATSSDNSESDPALDLLLDMPGQQSENLLLTSEDEPLVEKDTKSLADRLNVDTDMQSGAFVYRYPIVVPPGRNNMQADLQLVYNSQSNNNQNIFGYGWTINIPYIERINKNGTNNLYSDNYFSSSLSGELTAYDLSDGSHGQYVSRVEGGEFLKYQYNTDNSWTVTDKTGMVYTFGPAASSRQDDPGDSSRVYKWMLEEVRDTNDNFVRYEYYKNDGQIYPDKIFYTGYDTTDGIFEVDFLRQSRNDNLLSMASGFMVRSNYRIYQIDIKINNSWVKRYHINFTSGDNGNRSLVDNIVEGAKDEGGQEVSLPSTDFDYTDKTPGWTEDTNWQLPSFTGIDMRVISLADLNGDNYPDVFYHIDSSPENIQKTYINNGDGTWTDDPNCLPPIPAKIYEHGYMLTDANGDGLLDISNGGMYLNNGDCTWTGGGGSIPGGTPTDLPVAETKLFAEENGDGLVDIVLTYQTSDTRDIYLNRGTYRWELYNGTNFPMHMVGYPFFADINADGLDDVADGDQYHLNNGNFGLDNVSNYNFSPGNSAWGARIADANGDGLPDLLKSIYFRYGCGEGYCWDIDDAVYINNSDGSFTEDVNYEIPVAFGIKPDLIIGNTYGVFITDMNADGFLDLVNFDEDNKKIYLNNSSEKEDIIENIGTSSGASIDITYKASSQELNASGMQSSPDLPFIMQIVDQIDIEDGFGNVSTIDYHYSDGRYYFDASSPYDRKFAGFAKVEKNLDDSKTINYYHTGDETNGNYGEYEDNYYKIGKPYRQEVYDSSDELLEQYVYKWDQNTVSSTANFVYKDRQSHYTPSPSQLKSLGFTGFSVDTSTLALWHMNGDPGTSAKLANAKGDGSYNMSEGGSPKYYMSMDTQEYNGAYVFDGVDDYLSFSPFNPSTGDITLEGWVKPISLDGASPIFYQEQSTLTGRPNIGLVLNSNGYVSFKTSREGSSGTDTNELTSSSTIPLDGWTYIAAQRNNGVYRIYLNGQLDAEYDFGSNNNVTGASSLAYFARRHNDQYSSGDLYSNIALDEWRYSNTARTSQEIEDHYDAYLSYLDGIATENNVATEFVYDFDNGNLLTEQSYGKVKLNINTGEIVDPLTGDEKDTDYEYAENTSKYILAAPKTRTISDSVESKDQDLFYNNQDHGVVEKLNLTKEEYENDSVEINRNFNTYGLVYEEVSPENTTTTIAYDTYNMYPSATTDALNNTTYTQYNMFNGQIATSTEPNGKEIVNKFDAFGRLVETKISDPDNLGSYVVKQQISYHDSASPRYKETKNYFDASSYVTSREYYDGLDRVLQKKVATALVNQYSTVDISYDDKGRVVRQSLPYITTSLGYTSPNLSQPAKSYTYDGLDRVLTETTPVGTTTYDYDGFITTITDANGHQKDLTKDAYGNLIEVREYNDGQAYITSYEYTLTNKLKKITDSQGNIRNFHYDDLDNLDWQDMVHQSSVQNPAKINYTHDKNGNVLTETSFKGDVISYEYDDLNRVLYEKLSGVNQISYTYDLNGDTGMLSYVDYGGGNSKAYDYDVLGRLIHSTTTIEGESFVMHFDYNLNGDLKEVVYPNGHIVSYGFNSVGQVDDVSLDKGQGASVLAENITYNQNGQMTHLERSNGVYSDYLYDPLQNFRLTSTDSSVATTTLQSIDYQYDDVGNITQISDYSDTDLAKVVYYDYDDLNRLASSTVNYINHPSDDYSKQYQYDSVGNMVYNSALGTMNYSNNNPHQLSGYGSRTFVYDTAGNMTRDGGFHKLAWDWRNRLNSSYEIATEKNTYYKYDHNNQRFLKYTTKEVWVPDDCIPQEDFIPEGGAFLYVPEDDDSTSTESLIEGAGMVSMAAGCGGHYETQLLSKDKYVDSYFEKNLASHTRDHIMLGSTKLATVKDSNDPYFVLSDHLNSSSILVDSTGTVAQLSDYEPFGKINYENEIVDLKDDYTFTGKEYDEENSLQYYGARYLDNELGRFISMDRWDGDLADPQTLNKYAYVSNNPVRYTDPTGMTQEEGAWGWVSGIGESAWTTMESMSNWFWHPIESSKEVVDTAKYVSKEVAELGTDLMTQPEQTMTEIQQGMEISYEEFMSQSDYEIGKDIGNLTGDIMQLVIAKKAAEKLFTPAPQMSAPNKAYNVLKQIEKNNFKSAPQGYKGGGIFNNKEGLLPTQQRGYYQEWDINPNVRGLNRPAERIVTGQGGEAWYTPDHYKTFIDMK